MDFKVIWNEICLYMGKTKNATERDFQTTVELLFEKLGWSQFRGEIVSQEVIPVGAAQRVMPDIVIKNNGQRLFVVELKKPTAQMSQQNVGQLVSYMRLLRLNFGILLGETLQVFYEIPNDNKPPVKISNISFVQNSDEGAEIIEILSKEGYAFERFQKYCLQKLAQAEKHENAKKYINLLCSEQGVEMVKGFLKEKLLIELSEDIVSLIFNHVNISISRKGERINNQNQPTIQIPQRELSVSNETHITERAILIRINKTFSGNDSAQKLYDLTRSAWRLGERRNLVEYAFSVYKGIIIEVYRVNYWEPATIHNVPNGRWDNIKDVDRYQFAGKIDEEMSRKYKGKNISHYFKSGNANPIMFLNV